MNALCYEQNLPLDVPLYAFWQTKKKEGIFCQNESQTVRLSASVHFGKKQATAWKILNFPGGFLRVYHR